MNFLASINVNIAGYIIMAVVFATMSSLSIALFFGKGSVFISGYNYKAKGGEAKKYELVLCRAVSIFIMCLNITITLVIFAVSNENTVLQYVGFGLLAAVLILGLIFISTNKKIRVAQKQAVLLSEKFIKSQTYKKAEGNDQANNEK
ncbi:MAG: DUF3784 domain-containing protein [Clostridia bacterium]